MDWNLVFQFLHNETFVETLTQWYNLTDVNKFWHEIIVKSLVKSLFDK